MSTAARWVLSLALLTLVPSCGSDDADAEETPADVTESPEARSGDTTDPDETPGPKQILFGDLHVHSTHSLDAMILNAPILNGRGFAGPALRCDYARYCSQLDFWSINDHAETYDPALWGVTRDAIRMCNDLEGGNGADPDMVSFLGWEWTQVGVAAGDDWGHKNVIFRDTADDATPTRPIAASRTAGDLDGSTLELLDELAIGLDPEYTATYEKLGAQITAGVHAPACEPGVDTRTLPAGCVEEAKDPAALYEKLDQWGFEALVIPHGSTWGAHHPVLSGWAIQLNRTQHHPGFERLVEVYSGHGNMETYRPWRAVTELPGGAFGCPEPSEGYLPCCWRAGEIVRETHASCTEEPQSEACTEAVAAARQAYVDEGLAGNLSLPDAAPEDWRDCGQCTDCFQPAFGHRPAYSAQAALAMSDFTQPDKPLRYKLGMIGSTDSHRSGPGAGYKEARTMSDVFGAAKEAYLGTVSFGAQLLFPEWERQQSYFYSGGLVAVHSEGRARGAIWDALKRREVYATTGERMLLWFDLLNAPGGKAPMGSAVAMSAPPTFEVRAVGSFVQAPGCPKEIVASAPDGFVADACYGECYNPTDQRHAITRVEIVRIQPQISPDEALEDRITDPLATLDCPDEPEGCVVTFTDDGFDPSRPAAYYARVYQAPTALFNGDPLRCERDADGQCATLSLCPTGYKAGDDTCESPGEERAWSSPIFLGYPAE